MTFYSWSGMSGKSPSYRLARVVSRSTSRVALRCEPVLMESSLFRHARAFGFIYGYYHM